MIRSSSRAKKLGALMSSFRSISDDRCVLLLEESIEASGAKIFLGKVRNLFVKKIKPRNEFDVLGQLSQETGADKYEMSIKSSIDEAKEDKDLIYQDEYSTYQKISENTHGQFLHFLIGKKKVDDFSFLCRYIDCGSPNSIPNPAYNEMLMWLKLDDHDKIQELCSSVASNKNAEKSRIEGAEIFLGKVRNQFVKKIKPRNELDVLGQLNQETGADKYELSIKSSIDEAKEEDEDLIYQDVYSAYQKISENTHGQFLHFLIGKKKVDMFSFLCRYIGCGSPNSIRGPAYNEMLMWIKLDDHDKIQEFCSFVARNKNAEKSRIEGI